MLQLFIACRHIWQRTTLFINEILIETQSFTLGLELKKIIRVILCFFLTWHLIFTLEHGVLYATVISDAKSQTFFFETLGKYALYVGSRTSEYYEAEKHDKTT